MNWITTLHFWRTKVKKLLILITLLLIGQLLFSSVPQLKDRVTDYAGVLSTQEKMELETYLFSIEKNTSAQVALLIVKTLEGLSLDQYSIAVVEKWKLGQKGRDNGILILMSMKERKVRIEVGYGLEGIITDLKAGYIIQKEMIPYFKKDDFYMGTYKGVLAVGGLINKEYVISPKELAKYRRKSQRGHSGLQGFSTLIIIIIFFLSSLTRGGRRRGRGGLLGGLILGSMLGGSRGGNSSGLGGGGFGGFSGGGGGFGGGGASGGW